ncbi:MAG TPA: DUF4249 domain-containing protein, partial [Puia sp.]
MSGQRRKYYIALFLTSLLGYCKTAFEPPELKAANNYLVVDGVINIAPNATTLINVNRTRRLRDTATQGIPELHATVTIRAGNGATYPLSDPAGQGIYSTSALSLDPTQQYGIEITTADGRKYASDMVTPKPTPPIDSFYFEQPSDLTVYVNTHDPSNSTQYYRWDYVETWEHDAQLYTAWGVKDGLIFAVDSTTQTTQCWTSVQSSHILLDATTRLNSDVVDHMKVLTLGNGDMKINIKYSILLRQYALTEAAYSYWDLIRKTADGLGTLFDLQPTQLVGNIHCTTNPSEPVIGFVSASTIQQRRIFIYQSLLHNWDHNTIIYGCDSTAIPVNQTDYRIYTFPDTLFAPWYFITSGPLMLAS